MIKIAIIGAGNMGGAITRGLSTDPEMDITVSNPSNTKLQALKEQCPGITTTNSNVEAVRHADAVIICVKPWIAATVIDEIRQYTLKAKPLTISIAAGIDTDALAAVYGCENLPLAYAIPNTAIAVGQGMTFACTANCDQRHADMLSRIFSCMGAFALTDRKHMDAAMALSSCGIAYAYKYAQACVQAGVQLGFKPADALRYTIETVKGAMAMLGQPGATPQGEIDRVTTPGGLTIKGINQLEHTGFTSSVIQAILKPLE